MSELDFDRFEEIAKNYNILVKELETIVSETKESFEGGTTGDQAGQIIKFLLKNPQIKLVLEIGFNFGHSALNFLNANPEINVISVDLGEHQYVYDCKKIIDKHFPQRHQLIIGDSTKVIPQLVGNIHPDFIYIDGGHQDPVPLLDIRNCLALADNNTILCLDDTEFKYGWHDIVIALCTVLKTKEVDEKSLIVERAPWRGWTYFKKTPVNSKPNQ